MLKGQIVMVKHSEAEKNIAWEAAQQAKQAGLASAPSSMAGQVNISAVSGSSDGPCKLYVGNLHVNLGEKDLQDLLSPFGPLEFVTVQRDAGGRSQGYGFAQYVLTQNAMAAVQSMNGLEIAGQALKVSLAATSSASAPAASSAADLDDDNGDGGLRLDGRSRMALMARLAGQDLSAQVPVAGLPAPWAAGMQLPGPPGLPGMPTAALPTAQGRLGPASPIPTDCLLLKNLFNPEEETEDHWEDEIGDDVKEECGKYGRVLHLFVDKESQGFVYAKFADANGAIGAKNVRARCHSHSHHAHLPRAAHAAHAARHLTHLA